MDGRSTDKTTMPSGIIQNPRTGKNPSIPPMTSKTPKITRITGEPGNCIFRPENFRYTHSSISKQIKWVKTHITRPTPMSKKPYSDAVSGNKHTKWQKQVILAGISQKNLLYPRSSTDTNR